MREVLHAWRDFFIIGCGRFYMLGGRAGETVQAGDSLSMRESWKPWAQEYMPQSWVDGDGNGLMVMAHSELGSPYLHIRNL